MKSLRWLLVLLGPALGLVLAFVGAVLFTHALTRLCPPDLLVSGVCTAAWYPAAEQAAYALAAGLGAFAFVGLPARAAPDYPVEVAWIALLAGGVFAALFVWQAGSELIPALMAALVGGGLATGWAVLSARSMGQEKGL